MRMVEDMKTPKEARFKQIEMNRSAERAHLIGALFWENVNLIRRSQYG